MGGGILLYKDYAMPQNNSPAQSEQTNHIKDGGNFHHEQSEQIKPQTTPDFSHRLMQGYDASEVEDMTDAIETSLLKASAVLNVTAFSIIGAKHLEVDRDQLYWAIKSATSDLSDITAVIDAFHTLAHCKRQA
jgi:hypothetical protein